MSKLQTKKLYNIGPWSQSHKTILVYIYLLFCKLDHFIAMKQLLTVFIEWSSLEKNCQ